MISASPSVASPRDGSTRLSYLYGALVLTGVGYFLLDLPVQVTDSYGNMAEAEQGTLWDLTYRQFFQQAYLRPLLWGHIRVLLDLAGSSYFWIFRGWHVAQVALLIALFLSIVRPRGAAAAAAVPVGLGALIGMHTFAGTIREAFPANVAEAAGLGRGAEVLRMLRAGQDPHVVLPIHPEIISSTVTRASAVEAAVWSRKAQLVALLDREGALADPGQRQHVLCLARDVGVDEIVAYLTRTGSASCEEGRTLAAVRARSAR